jgi:minor extracellular serine protease Vpr
MSERLRVRRSRRMLAGVVAIMALAGLIVASTGSAANGPELTGIDGLQTPAWTPLGVSGAAQTLMVQMTGDPVTLADASAGGKLSKADKDALRAQLKAQQDAIKGSIRGLGGKVIADYQLAYNGIKVFISPLKAGDLEALPNVAAVRTIQKMQFDNIRGVPFIGAPAVWDGLNGLHGEGIKIAVIDTGIDYTNANFGGPGTTTAYATADANDTAAADPLLFGPLAPRVKGGTDLVGDAYDASADAGSPALIPHPDPNPLDCPSSTPSVGHGSHVAGSAAGSGILADGSTYTGAYNASTISGNSWRVAPGVAPKAEIYSVRVFGCQGSTDVTVDAIEWAVDHDMDVINMSLGSSFGSTEDPSAVATTNAAKDGVIVVTSAGNSGPNQYITGSPGTAEGAISTAAQDAWETTPGATFTVTPTITGSPFTLINANGTTISSPITGPIVVLHDNPATTTDEPNRLGSADESLGCSQSAYTFNGIAAGSGQIAVAKRGACARVAKAIFGQQAGAAVVIMTNNAAGNPPFEGQITSNPDTGEPFTVTIPFLGSNGDQAVATTASGRIQANAGGKSGTIAATNLTNTNFKGFASFSSGGPRTGDSFLKPDVTAPGVSIISTNAGSGNGSEILSGTSMASPHNAGAAALVRQAKPDWKVEDIKAAIVNTADPTIAGSTATAFRISRGGTGTIQPANSTRTDVIAYSNGGSKFDVAVSYGLEELKHDFSKTKKIKLENHGSTDATFNVAQDMPQGSAHSIALSASSVTVPAGGSAEIELTLNVPAATAGSSNGSALSFREVAGFVKFTPASAADNHNIALRVPYYLVPRAMSDVDAKLAPGTKLAPGQPATIVLTNKADAPLAGDADFYAWGLNDKKKEGKSLKGSVADVRAVGAQSFPLNADGSNQLVIFAINMWNAWSNPSSVAEADVFLDVNNDGADDYVIVGIDQGLLQTGTSNGRYVSAVFSTRSSGNNLDFFATAKTDSATMELPFQTSRLCRGDNPATPANDPEPCLNSSNPRFTYHVVTFDRDGGVDVVKGTARYNPWTPAITVGQFETLAPGDSVDTNNLSDDQPAVSIDAAEWLQTPALGLMVVTLDNKNGKEEANLIEAKKK